jgi:hypothetical protein
MSILLSIDPGKDQCGYALWHRFEGVWQLQEVGLAPGIKFADKNGIVTVTPPDEWFDAYKIDELAIEIPQIYVTRIRTKLQDLIDLTFAAGAAFGMLGTPKCTLYLPFGWKGQVPKDVAHERYAAALNDIERELAARCMKDVKKGLRHNIWDAVGIGLHHTGRRPRKL